MKILTQKILLPVLIIGLFSSQALFAQDIDFDTLKKDSKNLIKLNLGALVLKNYSFQYERAIGKRISVAAGIRFSPKSNLPFYSKLEELIDDPEVWESVKDFKTGNYALTPEIRFYMGKSVFHGFYLAPFARYSKYTADLPLKFDGDNGRESIDLTGEVTGFTGGLLLGAQWKIGKRLALDWWILGPSYGKSSGMVSGKKALSNDEQDEIRDALSSLNEDIPQLKTKYTVDANGASISFDGPWAGLRAGLSFGFRF